MRDTTIRSGKPAAKPPRGQPRAYGSRGLCLGKVWTLEDGSLDIGRTDEAALQFTDSGVSRKHAKLVVSSGEVLLVDLGSTNGTFVNGVRAETARLRIGDRVGIGPDAEFTFGKPAEALASPSPGGRLTKRELQIARLVAKGLTNAKIGEELEIKSRTVASHLDNIYSRLKLSGRADLTRWLFETGRA